MSNVQRKIRIIDMSVPTAIMTIIPILAEFLIKFSSMIIVNMNTRPSLNNYREQRTNSTSLASILACSYSSSRSHNKKMISDFKFNLDKYV